MYSFTCLFVHSCIVLRTHYVYIYTYITCMLQYITYIYIYIYCMYVYIDTLHMYVLPVYSTLVNIYIYIRICNIQYKFAGLPACFVVLATNLDISLAWALDCYMYLHTFLFVWVQPFGWGLVHLRLSPSFTASPGFGCIILIFYSVSSINSSLVLICSGLRWSSSSSYSYILLLF